MNFDLQRAFVALDRCVDERQLSRRQARESGGAAGVHHDSATNSLRSIVGAVADSLQERLNLIENRERLKPLLHRAGSPSPPIEQSPPLQSAPTASPAVGHTSRPSVSPPPRDDKDEASVSARPSTRAHYPGELSRDVLSLADEAMKRCGYVCHPYGNGPAPRPTYSYPHGMDEAQASAVQHAMLIGDGSESPPSPIPPEPLDGSPRVLGGADTAVPTPKVHDSPPKARGTSVPVPPNPPPTTPIGHMSPAGPRPLNATDAASGAHLHARETLREASATAPPFVNDVSAADTTPLPARPPQTSVGVGTPRMTNSASQTLQSHAHRTVGASPRKAATSAATSSYVMSHSRARSEVQHDVDYVLGLQHVPLNAESIDRLLCIASHRHRVATDPRPRPSGRNASPSAVDSYNPAVHSTPVNRLFKEQRRQPATVSESLSQAVKYGGRLRLQLAEPSGHGMRTRSQSAPHHPPASVAARTQTKLTPVSSRAAPAARRKKKKRTAASGTPSSPATTGGVGLSTVDGAPSLMLTGRAGGTPTRHPSHSAAVFASPPHHASPVAHHYTARAW